MKQTCFRINKDDYLTAIPCASLVDLLAEDEFDYWQEIESATPDELVSLIGTQVLHPFMMEDILDPGHGTLIDRYSDAIYIEFPTNLDKSDVGILLPKGLVLVTLPTLPST